MHPPDPPYLFSRGDLRSLIEGKKHALLVAIDHLDENRILNTDIGKLVEYFCHEYLPAAPTLAEGSPEIVRREETKLEANPYARIPTGSYISGTQIVFSVRFSGDPGLFDYAPSAFTSMPPHGRADGDGELIFSLLSLGETAEQLRVEAEKNIASIRQYLSWVATDLQRFINEIAIAARQNIEGRRQQLKRGDDLVEAIGFPIRKRDDPSANLFVPQVRKKVIPRMPEPTVSPPKSEPNLAAADYENILETLQHMALVMERSPSAFEKMNEEELRFLFLIPLNGLYEGRATGETFNFNGKTDIHIRVQDRNVFVAECAFWDGPEYLRKKVDQLLGYATWRDSKLAILVFNRQRKFSHVLESIPKVLRQHPNFKLDLPAPQNTWYRCIVRHRDDPNRELTLTVCAFEVPG